MTVTYRNACGVACAIDQQNICILLNAEDMRHLSKLSVNRSGMCGNRQLCENGLTAFLGLQEVKVSGDVATATLMLGMKANVTVDSDSDFSSELSLPRAREKCASIPHARLQCTAEGELLTAGLFGCLGATTITAGHASVPCSTTFCKCQDASTYHVGKFACYTYMRRACR